MFCQVYEGQGNIYKAVVVESGMIIKICDECEASWNENEPVTLQGFEGLTAFLKKNGLTYEGSTVKDLGYIEETTYT
jgi:hypothetical protein